MPARSIRSPRDCCRSRSEKRPRPSPSSWRGARSTVSPCAGARSAIPMTPRVASPRAAARGGALLARFTGQITQAPPRFSAVKIAGERAYDLARDGEVVDIAPRPVEIHRLELIETPDPDHAVLVAECGKGTYVRALARDLGRALKCLGHVAALRRTAVGPFGEDVASSLDALQRICSGEDDVPARAPLLPVEPGVAALPALRVSPGDAGRLARGQAVLLRGRDAPVIGGWVGVFFPGAVIALAEVEKGEVRPRRIFNLPRG